MPKLSSHVLRRALEEKSPREVKRARAPAISGGQ